MVATSVPCLASYVEHTSQPSQRGVLPFYGHAPGKPYREFSNFYKQSWPFDFRLPTHASRSDLPESVPCQFSEKAIMLTKAAMMGDVQTFNEIASASDPGKCKMLGRRVKPFNAALWEKHLKATAFEVVRQKFESDSKLRELLLSTQDKLICEATRNDKIWGIGLDMGDPRIEQTATWPGRNVLGEALMAVRDHLRKNSSAASVFGESSVRRADNSDDDVKAKLAVYCLEEEFECLRAMQPNQGELDIDYPKGSRARVKVQVEPLTDNGSLGKNVSCTMLILIPENYPHSPLELSIRSSSGLSEQLQRAFLRDMSSCATELVGQQALHPLLKQTKELLTLYTSRQASGSRSARFVVGDPVLACFHGKWYAAQVRSTFISDASERVTVLWDEEVSISEFEASELLPRVPPAHIEDVIGQRVLALFYGEWHPARIQRLLADDEVVVFWESEVSKSNLPISQTVLRNGLS